MKCPNCGKKVVEGAAFCEHCGMRIDTQQKKKGSYCPFCGTWNEEDSRFCVECGRDMAEMEEELYGEGGENLREHPNRKKSGSTRIIVICIVAVIALLAAAVGGGIYYMSRQEAKAEEEKQERMEAEKKEEEEQREAEEEAARQEEEERQREEEQREAEENEREQQNQAERLQEDYIIPDSSTRVLTQSDISDLTLQELNYARNEIFARYGREFSSPELQAYFNSKSWYTGRISPEEFDANYMDRMTETEKKNIELLKEEEYSRSADGYKLDQ